MHHEGPVSWLLQIPFLFHDERMIHVNGSILVFLFILVISIFARLLIHKKVDNYIVPSPKATLVTIVDLLVESLYNMCTSVLGKYGEEYFPMIAALFIFVWFSNLLGILPMSHSPSANLNTTIALGVASFLYYNYHGIRAHGFVGYCKHFLMGLGVMGIPIAMFEILSHVLRPGTLGLRLFLNLTIDHLLAGSFANLCKWILPVPLLLFGIVVCTIQAFLFAILTSVYIQMATEHEEHEEHGEHAVHAH